MTDKTLVEQITTALQTVYDPDFPLVDIYTLGLIYEVHLDEEKEQVRVVMADYLIESVKNATLLVVPDWEVFVEVTFDPMR